MPPSPEYAPFESSPWKKRAMVALVGVAALVGTADVVTYETCAPHNENIVCEIARQPIKLVKEGIDLLANTDPHWGILDSSTSSNDLQHT